jgi:predicted lysophospholipase L1 biosynthesis ABC-type transport system permease subunit
MNPIDSHSRKSFIPHHPIFLDMGGRGDTERVQLGIKPALRLGYDNLIRRFDRAMINVASVALGIAFLSTLLTTDSIYRAYTLTGGQRLGVETYQYWLMSVALIVSVVGISNAMLITVYERYTEIGTMKCLGAMDRHILILFLTESMIQGLIGGVTGYLLGLIGATLTTGPTIGFTAILNVPPLEMIGLLALSTTLSTTLSALATLYPAYRAARLDPVEALNHEL